MLRRGELFQDHIAVVRQRRDSKAVVSQRASCTDLVGATLRNRREAASIAIDKQEAEEGTRVDGALSVQPQFPGPITGGPTALQFVTLTSPLN